MYFTDSEYQLINNIEIDLQQNNYAVISGFSGNGKTAMAYYIAKLFEEDDYVPYYIRIKPNIEINIYNDIENHGNDYNLFIIDDIQNNLSVSNKIFYNFKNDNFKCKIIFLTRELSSSIKKFELLDFNFFENIESFYLPAISEEKILGIINLFKEKLEFDKNQKYEVGNIDTIIQTTKFNLIAIDSLLRVWLDDNTKILSNINLNNFHKYVYSYYLRKYNKSELSCLVKYLVLYSFGIEFIKTDNCSVSIIAFEEAGLIFNDKKLYYFEHIDFANLLLDAYKAEEKILESNFSFINLMQYFNEINHFAIDEIKVALQIANVFSTNFKFNNSLEILNKTINLTSYKSIGKIILFNLNHLVAINYRRLYDIEKSLESYQNAYNYLLESDNSSIKNILTTKDIKKINFISLEFDEIIELINVSKFLSNYGIAYEKSNNTKNALELHFFAINIIDGILSFSIKNIKYYSSLVFDTIIQFKIHLNNSIGRCYEVNDNFNKALSYYQKGIAISKENSIDDAIIPLIQNNIGSVYNQLKEYKNAIKILLVSIRNFGDYPLNPEAAKPYYNIAQAYFNLLDLENAEMYINLAEHYFLKSDFSKEHPEYKLIIKLKSFIILYKLYKKASPNHDKINTGKLPRNKIITVKYKDGTIKTDKAKWLQSDLENGLSVII